MNELDTRVLARQNAAPILGLIAGPALIWVGFSHQAPPKVRAALGILGAALVVSSYPQLRHEVHRLFNPTPPPPQLR